MCQLEKMLTKRCELEEGLDHNQTMAKRNICQSFDDAHHRWSEISHPLNLTFLGAAEHSFAIMYCVDVLDLFSPRERPKSKLSAGSLRQKTQRSKLIAMATTTLRGCLAWTLLLLTVSIAQGQLLCCSDAVYTITIDLELSCQDKNIGGSGIAETTCFTSFLPNFQEEGILLESIRKVDVYEIGPTFGLMARQTFLGPLEDGDSLEYRSLVGLTGYTPNALQVVVTAETGSGTPIFNLWGITFSDSCILPAIDAGDQIGWTHVVRLIPSGVACSRSAPLCIIVPYTTALSVFFFRVSCATDCTTASITLATIPRTVAITAAATAGVAMVVVGRVQIMEMERKEKE